MENILSVDIHRDEAAPHCHILLLPLLNGKMAGSDMAGGKQKLMAMHKNFHEAVASRYGLRKAPPRLCGASKQAAASAVLVNLRNTSDPALKSTAWATIRDSIESNPGPWLLALGLELDTPKAKPLRTMAAIFTGKGKGPSKEAKPIGFAQCKTTKPIGFDAPEKEQTLCSVGFTPKPALPAPADLTAETVPPGTDGGTVARLSAPCKHPASTVPSTTVPSRATVARQAMHAGATRHERGKAAQGVVVAQVDDDGYTRESAEEFDRVD